MNIDLWIIEPASATQQEEAGLPCNLCQDELQRAKQYLFEADRQRFASRRAILRRILGVYTGVPPDKIIFCYSPLGKPYLSGKNLEFSVSHSGPLFAVAICESCAVGLDIEIVSDFPLTDDLIRMVCSPPEQQELITLSVSDRLLRFLQFWTFKAFLYPQILPPSANPKCMSVNRDIPRQSTILPGGGSFALSK